jgi:hypothetical protein
MQQRCLGLAVIATRLTTQTVDDPVPSGGDDPAGRAGRDTVGGPTDHSHSERVLHTILGYFDIAERPHQYRDGAPVLLAEGALDLGLVGVDLHRQDQPSGFS